MNKELIDFKAVLKKQKLIPYKRIPLEEETEYNYQGFVNTVYALYVDDVNIQSRLPENAWQVYLAFKNAGFDIYLSFKSAFDIMFKSTVLTKVSFLLQTARNEEMQVVIKHLKDNNVDMSNIKIESLISIYADDVEIPVPVETIIDDIYSHTISEDKLRDYYNDTAKEVTVSKKIDYILGTTFLNKRLLSAYDAQLVFGHIFANIDIIPYHLLYNIDENILLFDHYFNNRVLDALTKYRSSESKYYLLSSAMMDKISTIQHYQLNNPCERYKFLRDRLVYDESDNRASPWLFIDIEEPKNIFTVPLSPTSIANADIHHLRDYFITNGDKDVSPCHKDLAMYFDTHGGNSLYNKRINDFAVLPEAEKWKLMVDLIDDCTSRSKKYIDHNIPYDMSKQHWRRDFNDIKREDKDKIYTVSDLVTIVYGKFYLEQILSAVFNIKMNPNKLICRFYDGTNYHIIDMYSNIVTYFNDLLMSNTYIKYNDYLKDWTSKDYQTILLSMIYIANELSHQCLSPITNQNTINYYNIENTYHQAANAFKKDICVYNYDEEVAKNVLTILENMPYQRDVYSIFTLTQQEYSYSSNNDLLIDKNKSGVTYIDVSDHLTKILRSSTFYSLHSIYCADKSRFLTNLYKDDSDAAVQSLDYVSGIEVVDSLNTLYTSNLYIHALFISQAIIAANNIFKITIPERLLAEFQRVYDYQNLHDLNIDDYDIMIRINEFLEKTQDKINGRYSIVRNITGPLKRDKVIVDIKILLSELVENGVIANDKEVLLKEVDKIITVIYSKSIV